MPSARWSRHVPLACALAAVLAAAACGNSADDTAATPVPEATADGGATVAVSPSSGPSAGSGSTSAAPSSTTDVALPWWSRPATPDASVTSAPSSAPVPTTAPTPATALVPTTGLAPSSTPTSAPQVAQWAEFDRILAGRLVGNGDVAAAVAVSVDGRLVHTGAYGVRDPAAPLAPGAPAPMPTTPTDKFRIASISKVLTATVTMELVESGQLSLDEPVGPIIGAKLAITPDAGAASITIRQLLSHTSGFAVFQPLFFEGATSSCPQAAAVAFTSPPDATPGSRYRYSNMNFCTLALVIEQVTGEPYEQAVTERVLAPLGITGARVAGTYDVRDGEVNHGSGPDRNYMENLLGAGSWLMSAPDIVTVINALDPATPGWHAVTPESIVQMVQPQPGIAYPEADKSYGLGLMLFDGGFWGHTGTIENTRTIVLHGPDGVTWALLVSGDYPDRSTSLRDIFGDAVAESGVTFT